MVFQYALPTNVTTFAQMGSYFTTINPLFGPMLLMALFAICFISFRSWNLQINLMATCWLCFVASLMLWLMSWVNFLAVVVFLLAAAILSIWRPGPDYD